MLYYKQFYYEEYAKNNVYTNIAERYSLNATESRVLAYDVTENLFNFFRSKESLRYFTAEEQNHMYDVKSIFNTMKTIYYASFIIFIACFGYLYYHYRNDRMHAIELLSNILRYASITCLGFLAVLFVLSVFFFDATFAIMHLLLFPQGNFTFPETSLLITLFPQQFFFDIALRIFIYSAVQGIALLLAGIWLKKNMRLHRHMHY
jgi:uncharacterized membrane protein